MLRLRRVVVLGASAAWLVAAAANAGGVFCIDLIAGCNDVLLVASDTFDPNTFSLNGYEYGCADPHIGLHGTLRIVGSVAYVEYVLNATYEEVTPRLAQHNYTIDIATLTGPGQLGVHYDGYHSNMAITGTVVPCSTRSLPTGSVGPNLLKR